MFFHSYRIQEINKITKRRLKEVKFFKQRLLNNYVEDWSVVPISDTNLDEDEDKKSISHLISKDKIKEEKCDEGILFLSESDNLSFSYNKPRAL